MSPEGDQPRRQLQLLAGADPFRLEAGTSRVLMLHGFASTPFEMRYLGEKLQRAGYTCVCPILPGHGTSQDFFARTRWSDWFGTAVDALQRLSSEAPAGPVAVIGQSLGALLALRLAVQHPQQVAALVCLATPLSFSTVSGAAITAYRFSALRLLDLSVPRPGGADIEEPRLRRGLPGYDRVPLRTAASFHDLQRKVRSELRRVTPPLLVLHGRRDHTAPVENAERLLRQAASQKKQIELFDNSAHVLSLDQDKAQVAQATLTFLADHHPVASGPANRSRQED